MLETAAALWNADKTGRGQPLLRRRYQCPLSTSCLSTLDGEVLLVLLYTVTDFVQSFVWQNPIRVAEGARID